MHNNIILQIPCTSNGTGVVNIGDDPSKNVAIHSTIVLLFSRRLPIDNMVTPLCVVALVTERIGESAFFRSGIPFSLQPIAIASGC